MKTPIHSLPVVLVLTLAACGQAGIRTGEEIPPQAEVSGAPADKVAIIRQRAQFTAEGRFADWGALHTDDCRRFSPELEEPLTSAQDMVTAIEHLKHAFPDYRLDLVRAVGNDTLVVVEFITQGTFKHALQTGSGMRIPPTGRSFRQRAIFVFQFSGNLISEVREYWDQQELNQELLFGGK